jgi:hypothetical protein
MVGSVIKMVGMVKKLKFYKNRIAFPYKFYPAVDPAGIVLYL